MMSGNLGMEVIAEGVENETQLALIKSLACHKAQGYLFSKPLPETEALSFMEASPFVCT